MKARLTPEDEFNSIIDNIEFRAMATDGPVTPTLQEATEEELSRLWELINEISPKRKALARKILKTDFTNEEACEYLRNEGLDPEQVGREGSVFVKTLLAKIDLQSKNERLMKQMKEIVSCQNDPEKSLANLNAAIRDAKQLINELTSP